jgi:hypothetical protein
MVSIVPSGRTAVTIATWSWERSTFGDWRRRAASPSARELRDAQLLARIREVHADSGGIYGSPRIHAVLQHEGESVSRERVERVPAQSHGSGPERQAARQSELDRAKVA